MTVSLTNIIDVLDKVTDRVYSMINHRLRL